VLLGAPLFSSGFQFALDTNCKSVSLASSKLQYLSSQEAFFLFKNCFSIPKWLHLLRSSPCWDSSSLDSVDISQRHTISDLNIHLSNASLTQATLRVRRGGVGVRSVADLAPSASFASSHLVRPLVSLIIQPITLTSFDSSVSKALSYWSSKCSSSPPRESLRSIQRAWDNGTCSVTMHNILASSASADRPRLYSRIVARPSLT